MLSGRTLLTRFGGCGFSGSERLGMGCLRFCTKAFRALTCREASFHARLKSSKGEALNRDRLERSRLETSSRAQRPRRRAGASIHSAGCGACSDVAEGSGRCKKRFRPPCWMTQQRLTRPATCLELSVETHPHKYSNWCHRVAYALAAWTAR